MGDDEASVRDRIMETIRLFPGIHLRGIVKHLETSTALARYHLESLINDGTVRDYEVGGFTRYFPKEDYESLSESDRRVLHVLRQERPLEIVLALLELGPMQHRDLLEVVGGSKGTLTYQLDKLADADVIDKVSKGPERGFHLHDPDRVRRLLARYEPVPEIVQHVHDTWEDLFSGHRRGRRSG